MPKQLMLILLSVAILPAIVPASALAVPSTGFYRQGGEIFDDWDLCRTRAEGEDGFFQLRSETQFCPIILGESLGENADTAYKMGQQLARDYPDAQQRAQAVFAFARDRVGYTSDEAQFGFPEFAQNADEVAANIEGEGLAYGDCEDYSALLAVMYKAAGFRSAIVVAPDHAATLVYLPEYRQANLILSVDGEPGWVWAEATGGNNPLGWMPERYIGAELAVFEVGDEAISVMEPPDKPSTVVTNGGGGSGGISISPFFVVLLLMWFLSTLRRRR